MSFSGTTTIDLLRHGEPEGGRRYRGQIDDPLSSRGWEQMREAVGHQAPWDRIFTSPLSRCSAFSRELAQRHRLPLEECADFMEIGFGEWEGKTAKELMDRDSNLLFRFWKDPLHNTPPGAETLHDFSSRVIHQWEQMVERHRGAHLLVVGHAGMMRMILSHILGMPMEHMFRFQIPNAGVSRIQVDHFDGESLPRLLFHAGRDLCTEDDFAFR